MAKHYQHVPGTVYLVTYTNSEGVNGCLLYECQMPTTIDGVIEHIKNVDDWVDAVDCKIRAIHDEDGTVRDVTEDIGHIMAGQEHCWGGRRPAWADYPGLNLDIRKLWFEDDPDLMW